MGTTVRIVRTDNFMAGTSEANFPRAQISRPSLPHGLSQIPTAASDFAGVRWPIWVEIKVGSTWTLAGKFDGLETLDTGVIHIPAVRELNATVRAFVDNGTPAAGALFSITGTPARANISMRSIRMNLTIPCDHRQHFAYGSPKDAPGEGAQVDRFKLLKDAPDDIYIDPAYTRSGYLDLGNLYALWLRISSWPEPRSIGGVVQAPEKISALTAGDALRNDLDMLKSHIRRRLLFDARVLRAGELYIDGLLCAVPLAGQQVKNLVPAGGGRPFPLNAVVTGTRWETRQSGDRFNIRTVYIFGNPPGA